MEQQCVVLRKKANAQFAALATYMPLLRFSLEDEEKREFSVERMSFMGDEDECYYLESGPLAKNMRRISKRNPCLIFCDRQSCC